MGQRTSATSPRFASRLSFKFALIIFCFYFDIVGSYVDAAKLRMCVVDSPRTTKRINKLCPKLMNNRRSEVECLIVNDRINCLRRLSTGEAEFAILEPEDLVLVGEKTEYDILVTHELRLSENDDAHYEMVALVTNDIKGFFDLKGKSFCHGGYDNAEDISATFAKYFQNWIIPRKCDTDKTIMENEIASLSEYFGSSCVPGPWNADAEYDREMKNRYNNLCFLCDNPLGCFSNDKYHGREGALLCLTESSADVAWVRLADALHHFKTLELNKTEYSLLCPDGSTRNFGDDNPCVWIRKPWPVVVASSSNAQRVAEVVETLEERNFAWQNDVTQLMQSYRVTLVSTGNIPRPDDFLRRYPGFFAANMHAGCTPSRTIRWCVASSIENRKCHTLKEIATAYGVEPSISCLLQPNRTAAIDAMNSGRCDIFVVKPEEELEARRKNLIPLVYAVTKQKQDVNVFAALVKNNSNYHTLDDLKGAKACFSGYRSIGWNAFVDIMANNTNDRLWNCSDLTAVSNYFKESCVLGLPDTNIKHSVPSNLYSACSQGDHEMNSTFATYECLNSGRGDVAFVQLKNGFETKQKSQTSQTKNLRSICLEKTEKNDDSCFLTWAEQATVMATRNSNVTNRLEEIFATLLRIDELFGQSYLSPTPAFSLYGPFDDNHDVMFPDKTHHLEREYYERAPRKYGEVVERLAAREKTYGYCSEGNHLTSYTLITTLLISIATTFKTVV